MKLPINLMELDEDELREIVILQQRQLKAYVRNLELISAEVAGIQAEKKALKELLSHDILGIITSPDYNAQEIAMNMMARNEEEGEPDKTEETKKEEKPQIIVIDGSNKDGFQA